MFNFFYVNLVIHIVILVDNVDKFVYNLIISLFADFSRVENFLESFSLIHHGSTGFVHIASLDIATQPVFDSKPVVWLLLCAKLTHQAL